MIKNSRKKAHSPMRFVDKQTRKDRRTGHDLLQNYIGTFGNNLQLSFGFFQKELALSVCDHDSLADSIRSAAYPPPPSRSRIQTSRSQLLPLLLSFQVPARSLFQNTSGFDHPDLSTQTTPDCRRRYALAQMGQTHLWCLPVLGSHQPAPARLHLGTQLGGSGRSRRVVWSARRFAFLGLALPLPKTLPPRGVSYSAPDHYRDSPKSPILDFPRDFAHCRRGLQQSSDSQTPDHNEDFPDQPPAFRCRLESLSAQKENQKAGSQAQIRTPSSQPFGHRWIQPRLEKDSRQNLRQARPSQLQILRRLVAEGRSPASSRHRQGPLGQTQTHLPVFDRPLFLTDFRDSAFFPALSHRTTFRRRQNLAGSGFRRSALPEKRPASRHLCFCLGDLGTRLGLETSGRSSKSSSFFPRTTFAPAHRPRDRNDFFVDPFREAFEAKLPRPRKPYGELNIVS